MTRITTALITLTLMLTLNSASLAQESAKPELRAQLEGASPATTTPAPPRPTVITANEFLGPWEGLCHLEGRAATTAMNFKLVMAAKGSIIEGRASFHGPENSGNLKFTKGTLGEGGLTMTYNGRTIYPTIAGGKLDVSYTNKTGYVWMCSLARAGAPSPSASPATDKQ
jgi:hypothetical protein